MDGSCYASHFGPNRLRVRARRKTTGNFMASPVPSNNSQQIASTSKIYLSNPSSSNSKTNSSAEISKNEPVSPPPPSRKDSDTAQLVEAELSNRLNKGGWKRLSLSHSPLSPHFKRPKTPATPEESNPDERESRDGNESGNAGQPEAGSSPDDPNASAKRTKGGPNGTEEGRNGERSRFKKRATVQRHATDASGSVELDGLTRLAIQKLGGQKALYRYVDVYENQRGYVSSFSLLERTLTRQI